MAEANGHLINRLANDGGYKDRTILVTGGTGFIGKVLVEKLLRTCPAVKKIYLMVRPKKGQDPQGRLDQLFSNHLFDLLKETRGGDIINKVVVVQCDITAPDLGLFKVDRQTLIDEVEIVFHSAASVRFDEPLKSITIMNVRGTKLMLDLAKECKRLAAFCHISTSYCHDGEEVLYEKTYPSPADPHAFIRLAESLNDEALANIEEGLLKTFPNTYSFTKAVGEGLVAEQMDTLPVIILRTSIVYPICYDPLPGWVDNMNGPVGINVAVGKGVLKVIHLDDNMHPDAVPADIVVNMFLLAAFDFLRHKKRRVYHCTNTDDPKYTWKEITDILIPISRNVLPMNNVLSYPYLISTKSRVVYKILAVLLHFIPALLLDGIIFLTGNKPFMWRVQKKIANGIDVLAYYTTKDWNFNMNAMDIVRNEMTDAEREIYIARTNDVDLKKYAYEGALCARLYIFKETNDTIPAAKRHMKIMLVVHIAFLALLALGFLYLIARCLYL